MIRVAAASPKLVCRSTLWVVTRNQRDPHAADLESYRLGRNMADVVVTMTRRVGRPPRHVEPELVQRLRSSGMSFREIARQTGFGYGTVRRAYQGISTTSRRQYFTTTLTWGSQAR